MICPNCGKKVRQRKASFCDACGQPLTQNAIPMQQPGTAQQTLVQQPGKKRRRVRWWMIALAILIAAVAAAGIVYYSRTQKQYTEAVYYDEDGEWDRTYYYECFGEIRQTVGVNHPEDSVGGNSRLKSTAVSRSFDVSEDEKVKGAHRVECRQWVGADEEESAGGSIVIWVFDRDENLIRSRYCAKWGESDEWETYYITSYKYDSRGVLKSSTTELYLDGKVNEFREYKYDDQGHITEAEFRTTDGKLVGAGKADDTYVLGTLRESTWTWTTYMVQIHTSDEEGDHWEAAESEFTTKTVYHYSFGLLTSADVTEDYGDAVKEYRIEYGYD